jgi:mannitol-1-phosphate/altronate dehydrogenase
MGFRYVDDAMGPGSPLMAFCEAFFEEQSPTLAPVPGVDTDEYKRATLKRFCNPYIKDTLARLAEDGSMKLVTTMRDAALDNARAGRSVGLFAVVVATWVRYLVGLDEQGTHIPIKDPRLAELQPLAREALGAGEDGAQRPLTAPDGPTVEAFLRLVFGEDLASTPSAVGAVQRMLAKLVATSARGLLVAAVGGDAEGK